MASSSKLEITNLFADDTKIKISVDNIRPQNLDVETIRQKVINFNKEKGGTLSTKMKSKNGFNWVGITQVRIVTTEKDYIF